MAKDDLNNGNDGSTNQGDNRLTADPIFHLPTLVGGGRRTVYLQTAQGEIRFKLHKRYLRLLIVLSDALREQLKDPAICVEDKGRLSAADIAAELGRGKHGYKIEETTVTAYVYAINKAIRLAAQEHGIDPPELITFDSGGYRITRPFPALPIAQTPDRPGSSARRNTRAA
ncbi:MAG: hypothetical protein ACHRHE_08855 [Tepidisphaerales bacterium]